MEAKKSSKTGLRLAALAEEVPEEGCGFVAKDTFDDLDAMVEQGGIGNLELAADTAKAEVAGTEDESLDAGGDECAGAHRAGFEGAVEGGGFEAVVAECEGPLAEGEDFGVGGGVEEFDGGVATSSDYFAVGDEDAADRDFASVGCLLGEGKRLGHPVLVFPVFMLPGFVL